MGTQEEREAHLLTPTGAAWDPRGLLSASLGVTAPVANVIAPREGDGG